MKVFYVILPLFLAMSCIDFDQIRGRQVYLENCAECHGADLRGDSAGPLIKTVWKYGRRRIDIQENVHYGIASTTMQAWDTILGDDKIRQVVHYIIEAQDVPLTEPRPIPDFIETDHYHLDVEILTTPENFNPWGIEFIDSNNALIIEQGGTMWWFHDDLLDQQTIENLPSPYISNNTGGFFDIALDPNYTENGWIYLALSSTRGDLSDRLALCMAKIIRGRIRDYVWSGEQTLFEAPDSLMTIRNIRWGGRMLFDVAGFLYFAIGDMDKAMDSQDLNKVTGKLFRIHPNGSIPADNPFSDSRGIPGIYAIGLRNVQGLAQHPVTGEIWMTDHGPLGGDELNILKKGANYGWPVITHGLNYDGTVLTDKTEQEGMEQPIAHWTPSIAISPAEFLGKSPFSKWENNILIGALAFEEVRRLFIEGEDVREQEIILKGYGRVRDIKCSPEGAIYVLLNRPGNVIKLTPEREIE